MRTTRRRSRLRRAVALLAGLPLVGGCAIGGADMAPLASNGQQLVGVVDAPDSVSGNVTVWSWDVAAEGLQALVPEFRKKYPKVTVTIVDIGYDNAYDKISVGLQSGSGLPDVVTVGTDHMAGYFGTFPHGFVDLAPAAKGEQQDFDPTKWQSSTDGHDRLYSLPWDSGPVGLFYRRDYLATAGVDPASLITWQQLLDAGKQIKATTGKKLLVDDITNETSMFPMLLQQQGASYFTPDGRVALDSPEALRALRLLKDMQDADLIDNEKGWDGLVSATKSGTAATAPTAVWWTGTLTSEMPELAGKFGVLPLPAFDLGGPTTSNSGGSTLAIPSQAANPTAAWAFVHFALASRSNAVETMRQQGLFPSYLPALSDPFFDEPQPYFGNQPVYRLFADMVGHAPPFVYTTDSSRASDLVNNMVAGVLLNGKDPAQALRDTARQIANATGRELAHD
ncbi:ABC transporter substrate-binding protein [Saccharopolyspora sp. NPDC002376]